MSKKKSQQALNISQSIKLALLEDLGLPEGADIDASLDITASLIPSDQIALATIITRDACILCGVDWLNEVFAQLAPSTEILWAAKDGDYLEPGSVLCKLKGNARALLTGERVALNFLQTLSATATIAAKYVKAISHTRARLLDTRKTLPGLRGAQKYAVTCGGGKNHRVGLYDAFLIKENHIMACGGISQAIAKARTISDKPVEVEVESIEELRQALFAKADIVMLDNFSLADIVRTVMINNGQAKLEVSGNVTLETIADYAETGIDYISVGALTKHIDAIDLSMRIKRL